MAVGLLCHMAVCCSTVCSVNGWRWYINRPVSSLVKPVSSSFFSCVIAVINCIAAPETPTGVCSEQENVDVELAELCGSVAELRGLLSSCYIAEAAASSVKAPPRRTGADVSPPQREPRRSY